MQASGWTSTKSEGSNVNAKKEAGHNKKWIVIKKKVLEGRRLLFYQSYRIQWKSIPMASCLEILMMSRVQDPQSYVTSSDIGYVNRNMKGWCYLVISMFVIYLESHNCWLVPYMMLSWYSCWLQTPPPGYSLRLMRNSDPASAQDDKHWSMTNTAVISWRFDPVGI